MKLTDANQNERVIVQQIHLDPDSRKRLQALGMLVGTPVTILQKKKSGTMVINLRGTRFALGSVMGKGIEVAYE